MAHCSYSCEHSEFILTTTEKIACFLTVVVFTVFCASALAQLFQYAGCYMLESLHQHNTTTIDSIFAFGYFPDLCHNHSHSLGTRPVLLTKPCLPSVVETLLQPCFPNFHSGPQFFGAMMINYHSLTQPFILFQVNWACPMNS